MRDKRLIACLFVALTLRLGFVFVGFPYLEPRMGLREDGDGYGAVARGIREGRFEDPTRGPLYSLIVAAAGSPLATKVFQSVLDTGAVIIVFALARQNFWAAWLWAVYPFVIWRCGFINREVVLTFLLAAYALLHITSWREGKAGHWFGAGVLLGLVNAVKPTFLLWVPVAFLLGPRNQLSVRRLSWFALGLALILAPWSYAIYRATDGEEFLPMASKQGGLTTFIGNYQPSLGLTEGPGRVLWMSAVEEIRRENAGRSTAELDRAFYSATWAQVSSNPLKALELVGRKCGRFWFFSAARREPVASVIIQAAYLMLAVIGLWRLWPLSHENRFLVGLVIYLMVLHALTYADLRYSLPVMPFVAVFAAAAVRAADRIARRSSA